MDNNNNTSPIMYQHITTLVFKELIKEKFPAPPSPDTHSGPQCFTYEEKNALNYAARTYQGHCANSLNILSIN